MSTKLQKDKKETKQIRIGIKWHRFLKLESAQQGILMSNLLDQICGEYFSNKSANDYSLGSLYDKVK